MLPGYEAESIYEQIAVMRLNGDSLRFR